MGATPQSHKLVFKEANHALNLNKVNSLSQQVQTKSKNLLDPHTDGPCCVYG